MMQKYDHVEDYLEVIAGLRDPVTLKLSGMGWFDPIINLARYDISVVRNMSEATLNGNPLTANQGELTVKLVEKYRRQLAGIGIDARKENLTKFRKPFRVLDTTKKIDIVDDEISMRFGYDQKMIEELREFSKNSQGHCHWDRDNRVWRLALTEYNVNWAVAWSQANGFEISDRTQKFNDMILRAEDQHYAIELRLRPDQSLEIINAADHLLYYIRDHIGDMSTNNLIKLVDYSAILGYSVNEEIVNEFDKTFGNILVSLMLNKDLQQDHKDLDITIKSIKDYAAITDRYPIVIYEPDLSNRLLSAVKEFFDDEEIDIIGNDRKDRSFVPGTKVVHSIRPITKHRIPLLIAAAGMITGGERQMMIQNSEKVVFFSAGVYNSKKKSQVQHL